MPTLEERDFIIVENDAYNIIKVTEAPPGDKGDVGQQGPVGPGFPIVLYRRGVVPVVEGRMRYRFPVASNLTGISAVMGEGTPPIGADIVVDIKVNGIVVYTLTIPDGAEDVPEVPLNLLVAVGDCLTVSITQVGSTSPGEDLSIFIRYEV